MFEGGAVNLSEFIWGERLQLYYKVQEEVKLFFEKMLNILKCFDIEIKSNYV